MTVMRRGLAHRFRLMTIFTLLHISAGEIGVPVTAKRCKINACLSNFKYIPTCIILIAAILSACGGIDIRPVYAAGDVEKIGLNARFGFGGFYKQETPTPVFMEITNSGDFFDGWAVANFDLWVPPTYYTKPVAIPPGGTKKIELECFGCFTQDNCAAEVSVLGQNGDPVSVRTIQAWMLGRADTLLVHLGEQTRLLDHLFTGTNPGFLSMAYNGLFTSTLAIDYPPKIFAVEMAPDELPENFLLMEGISVIAMRLETYISLDEDYRLRLFEYVSHGGNIIVYYRDGSDPVDGWGGDTLLPVRPAGSAYRLSSQDVIDTCRSNFNKDALLGVFPPQSEGKRRGLHGEVIDAPEAVGEDVWNVPQEYTCIGIIADDGCDQVFFNGSDMPGLVVNSIGSGRAGFAAFNPFDGGPTAEDEPVMLLGISGLLDPECPTRKLASQAPQDFRNSYDSNIQDFFRQGSIAGQNIVLKWLDALGPALIYLLVLPVLVIISRRRGQTILALFVIWSALFTVFILFSKIKPADDKIQMNEAAVVWCESLPPGAEVAGKTSSALYYSCFSYSAQTSTPHSVTWNYPHAVLDEIVSRETWPYGNITIDHPGGIRVPDLRVETISFRSTGVGDRNFTMKRPAPEISASSVLTITPVEAHLKLDAELPFPVAAARFSINSHHSLWVGKNIGPLETEVHLDMDLESGSEIRRHESLFPEFHGPTDLEPEQTEPELSAPDLGRTLQTLWTLVTSMPVNRGQFYAQSRFTGRPTEAYLVMASTEIPSEFTVDRGYVERHAVTILVITVPIVYKSSL